MVTPKEFFRACAARTWAEVSQLLQAGAQIHWTSDMGHCALHYASMGNRLKTVFGLLQETPHRNRMDINSICHKGETALHIACGTPGHEKMVILLLHLGADVNAFNFNMQTPLYVACSVANLRVVRVLLSHPDVNIHAVHSCGLSPFAVVCHYNQAELARAFLEHRPEVIFQPEEKKTFHPLHEVCVVGGVDILKLILRTGVDVNLTDHYLNTPLHYACLHPLSQAISPHRASRAAAVREESVKSLIAAGADVRCRNDLGRTPLHFAVQTGDLTIVQLLIKAGADVNATDLRGNLPLTFLNPRKESFPTVFQTLLEHGMDLWSVSRSVNARCRAAKDGVFIAMLVRVFSESVRSRGLCEGLNAGVAEKLCSHVPHLCSRMWRAVRTFYRKRITVFFEG